MRTCVYCLFLQHVAFMWGKLPLEIHVCVDLFLICGIEVFCKSGHILYTDTSIDYAAELNITLEVKNIILFTVTKTES